jgi:hypothetical protein
LKVQHLLLDLAVDGGKPPDVILIQESWEFSQQRFQDLDLHVRRQYVYYPCAAFNGVSALVHERWAGLVVHVSTKRQYQLLCFELRPDYRILVVNAHLPDSGSEAANGSLSLHLVGLEAEMNALWSDLPWCQLVFAGDLNTEMPRCNHFGEAISGDRWNPRVEALVSFAARWGLQWSSTFLEQGTYTHEQHNGHARSVLDYMCLASGAQCDACLAVEVSHSGSLSSDHAILRGQLTVARRPKRRSARRVPMPLRSFESKNRYAALVDDCEHVSDSLEGLGKHIVDSFKRAGDYAGDWKADNSVSSAASSFKEVLKVELAAVKVATGVEDRKEAVKNLNTKKKSLARARACDIFVKTGLSAPRASKAKSRQRHPLVVDGAECWDTRVWEVEFRKVYESLFVDLENSLPIQLERLRDLKSKVRAAPRLYLPLEVLQEVLSQGHRKAGTAPGLDEVTWQSVCLLPPKALKVLRRLLECRLNGDEGHDQPLEAWISVLAVLVPKLASPKGVGDWRPISLTSVLQKVFLATVVRLCEPLCRPLSHNLYGFREGHQTSEVAEAVRLAAAKKHRHGENMFALKADVARAFDNLKHDVIMDSLVQAEAPWQYVYVIMLELCGTKLDIAFQQEVFSGLQYSKGGKQGGTETPPVWNRVFDGVVRKSVLRWHALDVALDFDMAGFADVETFAKCVLDILVWADDCVLCSKSLTGLKTMFTIMTEELQAVGLGWKAKSLELLRIGWEWSERETAVCWGGCEIKLVNRFILLGICIDSVGSDKAAFAHREAVAWSHFHERKPILTDNRIPLRLRWARMRQTVERTLLHGAGAWASTPDRDGDLHILERKWLKCMLKQRQRLGENEEDFHRRLNRKITVLQQVFNWTSLDGIAKKLHFGWLGHVARHDSMYARILRWRGVQWRTLMEATGGRLGYARAGRPIAYVEDWIHQRLGPNYPELAQDRAEWIRIREQVVGAGQSLTHYSNRTYDLMGSRGKMVLRQDCGVVHFCDSLLVVQQTAGRWLLRDKANEVYLKSLRWTQHVLCNCLGMSSLLGVGRDMFEHCPRDTNVAADAVASMVLDDMRDIDVAHYLDPSVMHKFVGLAIWSLGASRGRVSAAAGVGCAVMKLGHGEAAPDNCTVHDMCGIRVWTQIVFCTGRFLGFASSVHAEFEAACIVRREAISWLRASGVVNSTLV